MSTFVIELDDRALALAFRGRVLDAAPSVVFDGSTSEREGSHAWDSMRRFPASTSTRHLTSVTGQENVPQGAARLLLAELRVRLEAHADVVKDKVWIATPVRVEPRGLGAVLDIAKQLSLPLQGFIDSATATAAALQLGRAVLVVEMGLHHIAVTAVASGSQARRRRSVFSERGGIIELYETWLDLLSTTMVKRTRFDPLHDAATEQALFAAMPAWARSASEKGEIAVSIPMRGDHFDVTLSRDQFLEAAQPIYRELTRLLHELRPAGTPVAIVLPEPISKLPGLLHLLEQFVGCELVVVPDGFAAAVASVLDLSGAEDAGPVRLLRRVPSRTLEPLLATPIREVADFQRERVLAASHVLFNGRAYALGKEGIVVGRSPESSTMTKIELPGGLAGVSRRHCTFVAAGDELVLVDHSSFGTYVNDERVSERVSVHAGDRVRIGEPGVELTLIAVGEFAGAAS